jgi:hypothetical protein
MFALNLADHSDARRAVVADPALLPDAVEESCASTPRPSASAAACRKT